MTILRTHDTLPIHASSLEVGDVVLYGGVAHAVDAIDAEGAGAGRRTLRVHRLPNECATQWSVLDITVADDLEARLIVTRDDRSRLWGFAERGELGSDDLCPACCMGKVRPVEHLHRKCGSCGAFYRDPYTPLPPGA